MWVEFSTNLIWPCAFSLKISEVIVLPSFICIGKVALNYVVYVVAIGRKCLPFHACAWLVLYVLQFFLFCMPSYFIVQFDASVFYCQFQKWGPSSVSSFFRTKEIFQLSKNVLFEIVLVMGYFLCQRFFPTPFSLVSTVYEDCSNRSFWEFNQIIRATKLPHE